MDLPLRLIKFWYPNSFIIYLRVLTNTLFFIEEDMAVSLMWRLLFIPLFHDFSLVGKLLSICFRLIRVLVGVFAFIAIGILITGIFLFWFSIPVVLVFSLFSPFPLTLSPFFVGGLALFFHNAVYNPKKRFLYIRQAKDIWNSTKLKKSDLSFDKVLKRHEIEIFLKDLEVSPVNFSGFNPEFTDQILQNTFALAKKISPQYVTSEYFFVALLSQISDIENELLKLDLKLSDFEDCLKYVEEKKSRWRKIYIWDEDFAVHHLSGINRGWLGAPTPALDEISLDLTKEAGKGNFVEFKDRSSVVRQVISILSQSEDSNVMLVGPAGSGKTTLVNYLASLILKGDAPPALSTKRLVKLEIGRLLSSVTTEGELALKIKNAFDEVKSIENIIIFIDEIHNLGIGESKNLNIYSLIAPYLDSDDFQFIASTEDGNFSKIIERNAEFARIFHKVEIPPPSVDDTLQIIIERAVVLARYKDIFVSFPAIKEIVHGANKYIHNRVLPDSAISILEEAEVLRDANSFISAGIIKEVLSRTVDVPVSALEESDKKLLLNLEEKIHENFIDQEEAVKKISDTLRRSGTSLREEKRPIGSFLFVGPTGVGKTELAKVLTEIYFKKTGSFLRFDMSEYQTDAAIDRLIGTLDTPGDLTEAVKHKPYCLLLLDEFEKADHKILNLFLQVLEDGRLTDAFGETTDFSNTIIITTSNGASITIAEGLKQGKTLGSMQPEIRVELLKVFSPELLNRFDEVVMFKPLLEKDLEKIVRIKLKSLEDILKEQGYLVEFNQELVTELGKKGFDPVMGARPLRRLIQDTLEAKLSRMILENKLKKGEAIKFGSELLNSEA